MAQERRLQQAPRSLAEQLREQFPNATRSEEADDVPVGYPCARCGSQMVARMAKQTRRMMCSRAPQCKNTAARRINIKCPTDGADIVVRWSENRGGAYFACEKCPSSWNGQLVRDVCPACNFEGANTQGLGVLVGQRLCLRCGRRWEKAQGAPASSEVAPEIIVTEELPPQLERVVPWHISWSRKEREDLAVRSQEEKARSKESRPVATVVADVSQRSRIVEQQTGWIPKEEPVRLIDRFAPNVVRPLIAVPVAKEAQEGIRTMSGTFRRASSTVIVQVGIDFGTSSTKVMFARLDSERRVAEAIDFAHGLQGVPLYSIPSVAAFDSSGELLLGDAAARAMGDRIATDGLTRFKMLAAGACDTRYLDPYSDRRFRAHVAAALGNETACTAEALSATFLAFVMRRVRRLLESQFSEQGISLIFNTCVPIDQREHGRVSATFERIIGVAEAIESSSTSDSGSAREWLEQAVALLGQNPVPEAKFVFLIPEALALTAGYLASLAKSPGLHAIVDIGAGTTDVSIMYLTNSRSSGTTSVWYAATSVPSGASHIELHVRELLEKIGAPHAPADVVRTLSDRSLRTGEMTNGVRRQLEMIKLKTAEAWAQAYRRRKSGSEWTGERVRVFLAGGGALIPEAIETFRDSWVQSFGSYPCTPLPDPEGFDSLQRARPFVRVAVAYGLTIPAPELGEYILPSDAPDDSPPKAPRREYERWDGH